MKRFLLFVAILVTFSVLLAIPVEESTARGIASFQLELKGKSDYTISTQNLIPDLSGNPVAYVYSLDPQGFVIVGVDTDLPPVVGYSFTNDFDTEDSSSLGYLYVQDDMSKRLSARELTSQEVLIANNDNWSLYLNEDISAFMSRDRSVYPPEGHTSTGGWVDLEWDQGYPWNMYCPMDNVNGGRSVTGCVATALSMILAYHEYIGAANFDNGDDYASNYEGFYCLIDDYSPVNDFPDFPTLNSYLVDVQESFAGVGSMSEHVKATINFAAGVAVRMKYSNVASGSYVFWSGHFDTREALLNKFGYDSAQGIAGSSPQFYGLLQDDMMNGRPAVFGILGGSEGHAILCDGYNTGDNLYHLNMGWGGYDNGWYSLPYGMPAGYNTIDNAVINIEGGGTLFDLFALVSNSDGSVPANADIEFRGSRLYEGSLDGGGSFAYDFMHEGTYTVTSTYENPGGGYFYKSQTFDLNDNNDFLMLTLDDYTTLTGNVSGVGSPEGAVITYYNNEGEIMSSGLADASGDYTIAGIMPGTYLATASWGETYFAQQEVEITATQQNFNFALENYPETGTLRFYGGIGEIFHLVPTTMSCAIKLTPEDLTNYQETVFNKVRFVSPIAPADGQLWGQVWMDGNLVSEKAVDSFGYGEVVEVTFDNLIPVEPEMDYFVGFKVQSTNADFAWFDTLPRVEGKGAWFRINSWTEVSSNYNHNFVITAKVMSTTADGEEFDINPVTDYLGQNYPNPFNPETNISFSLAETGQASLEIFNIKGQKVKTLVNGMMEKGEHILHWSGNDDSGKSVSSGIYFYKLKNGRYTSTKKMILMK
ncbi:MAG: C10 family peptidase [Candidatus Cloacimonetes bacterium]|nr:C10 family peptidase [Candidatus Cloacimonadota bacterium]